MKRSRAVPRRLAEQDIAGVVSSVVVVRLTFLRSRRVVVGVI